jgi:hypothetical protein
VFNTVGPCLADRHYMVPPEPRLPRARELVEGGYYFVVHAPRQTGKTTTLAAVAGSLLAEGRYVALRFSCESGQAVKDDYVEAQRAVLDAIADAARNARLPAELAPPDPWPDAAPAALLRTGLREWAARCPKPLVLFFDEIDALYGQSLLSVLRQLRDGYTARPAPFPHSVVLCGLRDIRDYRISARGDKPSLGTASPFNIKVESLRLGDFTEADLQNLYGQHTAETGQEFTEEALQRAWDYTQGQPWLTNALADEIVLRIGIEPPEPITAAHMDEAKERLVLARATHLDSLVDKSIVERAGDGYRMLETIRAHAAGKLRLADPAHPGRGSGYFALGMGKLGAGELNYSSDIDLIALDLRLLITLSNAYVSTNTTSFF